jgi:endonuclease-8
MPEGDALHRAARRLQVLVGQQLEVETPHPRAAVKQLAPRLDGLRLEHVEAIGKNLLLRFEGGLVLRSHLRMKGRWLVLRRDDPIFGRPWLVLRGDEYVGAMFNGAVLELDKGIARRLGPDILAEPPDYDTMLARLRAENQQRQAGDALLDQRLVAGIGNLWKAESLWHARVSPWRRLAEVTDAELHATLEAAHRLMRGRLDGAPGSAQAYRRKGRPCPRCGTAIKSWPQGDDARMAYWCPECQRGEEPKTA